MQQIEKEQEQQQQQPQEQTGQLIQNDVKSSLYFIIKFVKDKIEPCYDKQLLVHYSMDTLNRFIYSKLGNLENDSDSARLFEKRNNLIKEIDFYMLGLACISLASKNLSIHYGSLQTLAAYYVINRPTSQDQNNSYQSNNENLQSSYKNNSKESLLKTFLNRVHENMHRVEFEVFQHCNLELTKIDQLPLITLRKFMFSLISQSTTKKPLLNSNDNSGKISACDYEKLTNMASGMLLDQLILNSDFTKQKEFYCLKQQDFSMQSCEAALIHSCAILTELSNGKLVVAQKQYSNQSNQCNNNNTNNNIHGDKSCHQQTVKESNVLSEKEQSDQNNDTNNNEQNQEEASKTTNAITKTSYCSANHDDNNNRTYTQIWLPDNWKSLLKQQILTN